MSQKPPIQIQEKCESCGLLLDVGEERLFALVKCPKCGAVFRVRKKIEGYEFLDVLGRGGCGRVLRARRQGNQEEVALKILEKSHPEYNEYLLFLRSESEFAKKLQHPAIVRVFGLEEDKYGARLSMEFMGGGSLHDRINLQNKPSEMELLKTGFHVATALAVAYQNGILHRDLKPANILFTTAGDAKLADFGLAQSILPEKNTINDPKLDRNIMATPDYVAPEILNGEQGDFRSDIYALGGTLFHGFTGNPPFVTDGLPLEELLVIKRSFAMISSAETNLLPSTTALINQMLDPYPNRRFSSYQELIVAFRVALNHLERKVTPPTKSESPMSRLSGIFTLGKNRIW